MSELIPLDPNIVDKKGKKLSTVLMELSKVQYEDDDPKLSEFSRELLDVYSGEYRQMYSSLYPIILEIDSSDACGLDTLTNNLEVLRNHIRSHYDDYHDIDNTYLYSRVLKLSDHVNLEVQRLTKDGIFDENYRELRENMRKLNEDVATWNKSAEKVGKTIDDLRSKISGIQTETVVILGVFSAIVIAFSGGLTFIGASMESMANTDFYKLSFIVVLCGLVIFNTIVVLMNYVNNIVLDLYEKKSPDKTRDRRPRYDPFGRKVGFRQWYALLFNILMIAILATDLFFWSTSGTPIH